MFSLALCRSVGADESGGLVTSNLRQMVQQALEVKVSAGYLWLWLSVCERSQLASSATSSPEHLNLLHTFALVAVNKKMCSVHRGREFYGDRDGIKRDTRQIVQQALEVKAGAITKTWVRKCVVAVGHGGVECMPAYVGLSTARFAAWHACPSDCDSNTWASQLSCTELQAYFPF